MGIGDKLEGFTTNIKTTAQSTTVQVLTAILRVLTGLILGYVLGLIGQELMGYGGLGVLLFVVVTTAVFYRASVGWSFLKIVLFDIFCALVLQILKMYIMLAP